MDISLTPASSIGSSVSSPPVPSAAPIKPSVIASVAIAAVAGISLVPGEAAPKYKGTFQLLVESSPASSPQKHPGKTAIPAPSAAPTIDYGTQIEVLWSPKLLSPVVEQLQAQYPDLNYEVLSRNLKITHPKGKKTLRVSYQDPDPKKVQAILEQVAQAYLKYSQTCKTKVCRELDFIESQLPQARKQVELSQKKLLVLQQQYGFSDLQALGRQLSERKTLLNQQQQELQIDLAESRTQFATLQKQLGLPANHALAEQVLNRHQPYQQALRQFQPIADQLSQELARPQTNTSTLQSLKQHYQHRALQLSQAAQQAVLIALPGSSDPVQAATRQHWIDAANRMRILQISSDTIAQAEAKLASQVNQWALLARDYAEVQQELQSATTRVNQYLNRQVELQPGLKHQQPWQMATPLAISQIPATQSWQLNPQRDLSFAIAVCFVLVVWALTTSKLAKAAKTSIRLQQLHVQSSQNPYKQPLFKPALATSGAEPPLLAEASMRSVSTEQVSVFLLMAVLRAEAAKTTHQFHRSRQRQSLRKATH